ncbi:MAG: hypothetical protein IJY89_05835, partial [Clostridia bacterium]|nr:hypothetical protein [Clostridia bacterium]
MAKKEKKNKEKKKKDKDALSFLQIVRYNFWALGIMHKAAPGRVAYEVFNNIYWAVLGFLIESWLLRFVLNSFQEGSATLGTVLLVIGGLYLGYFVTDMLKDAINYFILPKWDNKIVTKIQKELFEKSLAADIDCYERPDFYDKYVKAMDEASGRVFGV